MSNKIVLGTTKNGSPLAIHDDKFTKHATIVGMTGSGKTGLLLSLVEQFVTNGTPVLLVDIKGDMANILLQDDPVLRSFMDIEVLTPGGNHGKQVNLFANLQKPERVQVAVSQILKMSGEKNVNPLSSKNHALLSKLLEHFHRQHKTDVNLEDLINGILDPPFLTFGALPLDDAIPSNSRAALAAKLNTLLVAPSFSMWREGKDLQVDRLLTNNHAGRTKVCLYSVAHLDEDQKLFALALLLEDTVSWMRKQSGSDQLRAVLVIDECAGLLPPYPKNPATKHPIMTILKQARAYGLGMLLASQNPMDLDYKAMSNCETWMVGRLQMANDRKRVVEAVASVTAHDRQRLEQRISGLEPRQFVLYRPQSTASFRTLDCKSNLTGPMTPTELKYAMGAFDPTNAAMAAMLGDLIKGQEVTNG